MRAINAAYALLSDPARRAAFDARRLLLKRRAVASAVAPHAAPRPAVQPPPSPPATSRPPTRTQRAADRVVAVLGIMLLLGLAFYIINVIPYADRLQAQASRPGRAGGSISLAAPDSDHPTGNVPDRLRADDTLRAFPGAVLVAPNGLQPFEDLPIVRVEGASRGIARYAVYYGNLTSGGATISGFVGRDALDNAPKLKDCSPDAGYCVGLAPGQSTGPAGLELFRAPDLVQDFPSFALHRVCCNGVFWTVSWYEPRANVTYTIDLSRSVAAHFGTSAADANTAAARAVAALGPRLVRLG